MFVGKRSVIALAALYIAKLVAEIYARTASIVFYVDVSDPRHQIAWIVHLMVTVLRKSVHNAEKAAVRNVVGNAKRELFKIETTLFIKDR